MLGKFAEDYLKSRTYTSEMITEEEILYLREGSHIVEGTDIRVEGDSIGWICRAMSGCLIGIQTRGIGEKNYKWNRASKAQHLPIIYGSRKDHETFYKTGRMILTEGIFDRGAIRRCFPHYAAYARLSNGVGRNLANFIQRYGVSIWLAFDQDEPGQKATERVEKGLKDKMNVNTLKFPLRIPLNLWRKRERITQGSF